MSHLFQYVAYGLRLGSDIGFAELPAAPGDARPSDIMLWFTRESLAGVGFARWTMRTPISTRSPWLCCARTETGYLLRFPGAADFHVSADGAEIHCCSATYSVDDADLHHLVLDHVMPLALKLRGEEALHASAVLTSRGACAFVGPSGCGKSTLAAAFQAAGDQVLGDDCVRLCLQGGRFLAVPAYPGVRLRGDVWEAHASSSAGVTIDAGGAKKRRWTPVSAHEQFVREPQPLRRLYRLATLPDAECAGGPRLDALSIRETFMELVSSTFRFDARDRRMLAAEFTIWERMASTVKMRRLWLDHDVFNRRARALVLTDLADG